jgi:hypothetical protein
MVFFMLGLGLEDSLCNDGWFDSDCDRVWLCIQCDSTSHVLLLGVCVRKEEEENVLEGCL